MQAVFDGCYYDAAVRVALQLWTLLWHNQLEKANLPSPRCIKMTTFARAKWPKSVARSDISSDNHQQCTAWGRQTPPVLGTLSPCNDHHNHPTKFVGFGPLTNSPRPSYNT